MDRPDAAIALAVAIIIKIVLFPFSCSLLQTQNCVCDFNMQEGVVEILTSCLRL